MVDSFRKNQRGAVAMIFALALIPMLAFMGVALDYTRASDARAKMQAAIDSTALAVAHEAATMSDADFSTQARSMFDGNFPNEDTVAVDSFAATRNGSVITLEAAGHLKTSLLGAIDVSSVQFGAKTTAESGSKNIEVVMALDNTGSMNDVGKIGALRDAATALVDQLSTYVTGPGQLKIGMVPFATDVRVDPNDSTYNQASWIDFTNATTQSCSWTYSYRTGWTQTCTSTLSNWSGCIQDRSSPYNSSDAAVTGTSSKYPATLSCGFQENLTYVQPLTTDFAQLKTQIGTMTAGGSTNVTIGAIWGLSLLSQQAPFTQGVAYSDTDTEKFLILLTDGWNTKDRWTTCPNEGPCPTIDARTTAACTAAKTAGVTVITIRVIDGNATLLSGCASGAANYHEVTDATQLVPTFIGIANTIEHLRLTT
jgi:Flp pilus assembly protein TadG